MKFRPRVLVIDDLVGKELPEEIDRQNRSDYCQSLGLWDEATPPGPKYSIVADAFISSGQRITPSGTVNNLEMIEQDFSAGWPDPSGRFWSAVLVDMKFGDDSHFGLRIIELIHRLSSELPIIVVSSLNQLQLRAGETLRHAAERLGAQDFLAASGVDFEVEPAHRSTPDNLQDRLSKLGLIPDPDQQVVGLSLSVCRMLRDIRTLVPNDVVGQILLLGEAGSGKSHLVGYVHRHIAQVQQRTLNRVRCQNVTLAGTGEEMQRKALFGTTEATGVKDTPGAFQDVEDGGLLFLDEIGELTASSQSDLLGALQPLTDTDGTRYRDVRRMGARKGIKSRCFVLAATNRDLEVMANEGQFNEALLQRFANKQVRVSPLRDRKSDLPLLIEHFVEGACRQYQVPGRPKLEVSAASWDRYADAHAIRQLAALIEGTISRNRFKTLLTEKDFFGDMPVSVPVSLFPNTKLQAPPTSPPASTNVSLKTPGTVSALVSHLDSWIPEIAMDPREFDEAFVRLDAAFGKAKLRLWRDLVERQKSLAGTVNLLATARQLLGRPQIVSSKSGDLAAQTFMEARITERPSDPVLAEIWDRRRVSKRSLKDKTNEPED